MFKKGNTINVGRKFSQEHKNKISLALKDRKRSIKHSKNISLAKKGKPATEKQKLNCAKMRKLYKLKLQKEIGKTVQRYGYIYVYLPNHPFQVNKYVKRANLVMEKKLGRFLNHNERVHHSNFNKLDDTPNNLMYFHNESEHQKHHWQIKKSSQH